MTATALSPSSILNRSDSRRVHVYWLLFVSLLLAVIAFLLTYRKSVPLLPPLEIDRIPAYARVPVTIQGGEHPLKDVLENLAAQSKVRIESLTATIGETFTTDAKVSLAARTCSLAEALQAVTAKLPTPFRIEYDKERIILGTPEEVYSVARAVPVIYPIGDLLVVDGFTGTIPMRERRLNELQSIFKYVVEPDAWRDNGGAAGVILSMDDRLVITATPGMHRQIQLALEALRKR
jgi:hypothetical protein